MIRWTLGPMILAVLVVAWAADCVLDLRWHDFGDYIEHP